MAKEPAKTMDEESAEKKGFGGVSGKEIKEMAGRIKSIKEKTSKLGADLGADLTKFEEKGGHKKALKVAQQINDMEIENAVTFFNSLEAYLDVLGFFEQKDMFEQTRQQQLNAETVAQASAPAKGTAPKSAAPSGASVN